MNFLSEVRRRIGETIHAAEEAATHAAAKAEAAVTSAAGAVKGKGRTQSAPPAPSESSLAFASQAAADAARNAGARKRAPSGTGPGIFVGSGMSAAAGGDAGIGGQISSGYVFGANGDVKRYGSTGVVNGAVGLGAGAGFEAGVIVRDTHDFYGDGYALSVSVPLTDVSASVSFTRDKRLTALSVGVGKSMGAGIFHFDTHTKDTTGQ